VFQYSNIAIEALAGAVPKTKIRNDHFSHLLNKKELRIFTKTTGIEERRYADSMTSASDLGYHAAKQIIEDSNKSEIKALVFVSQTSDYKIPFTSNILQNRLGLAQQTLCLDINAGCAGFVQGLNVAYSLVNSLDAGKVLLVISETLSKILAPNDRTTTTLFGDGAVALLIGKDDSDSKSYFNFFSDGENYDAIIIPDGGYKNPFSSKSLSEIIDESGNKFNNTNLQMDGSRVFDFTLREIPKSIESLLAYANVTIADIDYFVPHQSNKFIIKQIANAIGASVNSCFININSFGNTSGVSIPLAILSNRDRFVEKEKFSLLCSGYGSGLNWGNCVINLGSDKNLYSILEI
jgi:3-oxoacyl-[acyl-carrier-protein] synthase-3